MKQDDGPGGGGDNGCGDAHVMRIVFFGVDRHVNHVEAGRRGDRRHVAARRRGERGQFRHAFQLDPHGHQKSSGLVGGGIALDHLPGGLLGFVPREVPDSSLPFSDFGDELVHQRRLRSMKRTVEFQCRSTVAFRGDGYLCSPHSIFSELCHRPDRGSAPG